eukprot:TRINITY_DN23690_c0_g1_i1.p1 TRINITY_DN23690_c0_g1~~TRINITY_DN23690_c0_g1_i1.p1  ORF type:complete len:131 (+),score=29.48 TRINITY_DN23690_c0_g1_i1:64-456(+)
MCIRDRLKITPGKDWNLKTISATIYSNRKAEKESGLFRNTESSYLSKCLTEPELFGRVNKALCEVLCNVDRNHEDKMKAMGIVSKVTEVSARQFELVRQNVNLERFIAANIYQAQTRDSCLLYTSPSPRD